MTPAEMAALARSHLGDAATSFATNTVLLPLINRGLVRAAVRMRLHNPSWLDVESADLSPTSNALTIPSGAKRVVALKRTDATDDGEDVKLLPREADAETYRGRDDVWFVRGDKIVCCSTAPAGATYKVTYVKTLTAVTDLTSVVEYTDIPDESQDLAVMHAVRWVLRSLGRDTSDATRSIVELENEMTWDVTRSDKPIEVNENSEAW